MVTNNLRFNDKDEFETAAKRYRMWPTTVWEIKDSTGDYKSLKRELGDAGAARSHTKASHSYKTSVGKNKAGATTSIFPPAVANQILSLFIPKDTQYEIFDPFAGGGTRAVMAAKHGHQYTGVEIRAEEVANIEAICEHHNVLNSVQIINGDARDKNVSLNSFDFLYTCPPYWTLEQYQGGDADLSMMQDYDEFIDALWQVVLRTRGLLKPGALSCWVTGLHRKADGVEIAPMHHDLAALHKEAGFTFKEEIIIYRNNAIALRRVGNFERGNKLLIRQHEYCQVFVAP